MGRYQCVIIPVMVLLLATLATLSLAARTPKSAMNISEKGPLAKPTVRILSSSGGGDDFEKKSDSCQAKLDKGAPDCFREVYFKSKLPIDNGECCRNLMRMDKDAHDCWDYLFDDPATTLNFQISFAKCYVKFG